MYEKRINKINIGNKKTEGKKFSINAYKIEYTSKKRENRGC